MFSLGSEAEIAACVEASSLRQSPQVSSSRCGFSCWVLNHSYATAHVATSIPILMLGLKPAWDMKPAFMSMSMIWAAQAVNSLSRTLEVYYKYLGNTDY